MAREMTRAEFERKMRFVAPALARAAGDKLPASYPTEKLEAYRMENNQLYRRKSRAQRYAEAEAEWIERASDMHNERAMFAQ